MRQLVLSLISLLVLLQLLHAETFQAQPTKTCPDNCNSLGTCNTISGTCNCNSGRHGAVFSAETLSPWHIVLTVGVNIVVLAAVGGFFVAVWLTSKFGIDLINMIQKRSNPAEGVQITAAALKCTHCKKDSIAFAFLPKQKDSVYNIAGATVNLGSYSQCILCYRSIRARQFLLYIFPFLVISLPGFGIIMLIVGKNNLFTLFYLFAVAWIVGIGAYSTIYFVLVGFWERLGSRLPVIGKYIGNNPGNQEDFLPVEGENFVAEQWSPEEEPIATVAAQDLGQVQIEINQQQTSPVLV